MTDAERMQLPAEKPDAVKFDRRWQPPGIDPQTDRRIAVQLWAEEAMGARRVHVHPPVDSGPSFVSRRPEETELFPYGHPQALAPRYRWVDHPSGCQLGYYVDGAADVVY